MSDDKPTTRPAPTEPSAADFEARFDSTKPLETDDAFGGELAALLGDIDDVRDEEGGNAGEPGGPPLEELTELLDSARSTSLLLFLTTR